MITRDGPDSYLITTIDRSINRGFNLKDLKEYLKNAPYSWSEENLELIDSLDIGDSTVRPSGFYKKIS